MNRRKFMKWLGIGGAGAAACAAGAATAVGSEVLTECTVIASNVPACPSAAPENPTIQQKRKKLMQALDEDFSSPYLYVEAGEDLENGNIVVVRGSYKAFKCEGPNRYPAGIAVSSMKKGKYGFIQVYGPFNYAGNIDQFESV